MFRKSQDSERNYMPLLVGGGIALLIIAGVLFYLFGDYHVSVSDMYDNIRAVEENGRISFEFSMTDAGTTGVNGEISKPVIRDYASGICYHYYFMNITAQRFHMSAHPGVMLDPYFILDETGREVHSGKWTYDPSVDYEKNPQKMGTHYLRVYYVNADGSMYQIWEHPDARTIIERSGVQLREPTYYRLGS